MSSDPRNDSNEERAKNRDDGEDKPKKRKKKLSEDVPPITKWEKNVEPPNIDSIKSKPAFKKLVQLEEVKIVGVYGPIKDPQAVIDKIFSPLEDELEITYICRDCNRTGKTFCRKPSNKENLMTRVMNAVYIAHAMNDLLCPSASVDIRMVDSKGNLV